MVRWDGGGQWETRILSAHALSIQNFEADQMKKCFLAVISKIESLALFSLFKIWNNLK